MSTSLPHLDAHSTTTDTLTSGPPYEDLALLTYDSLDSGRILSLAQRFVNDHPDLKGKSGAVTSFVGLTRGDFDGKVVTHLFYESYIPLALKTMVQIMKETRDLNTFSSSSEPQSSTSAVGGEEINNKRSSAIQRMEIHHRLGDCPVGETSVVIIVASSHRKEGFEVCSHLLEETKRRVQIWKQEWYGDGTLLSGVRDGGTMSKKPDSEGTDMKDQLGGGLIVAQDRSHPKWKENFPAEM